MVLSKTAETSVDTESLVARKELACPPSTQPITCRSRLNITTTADTFIAPFCPTPTPKSASFPTLPSSFSKPPPEVPPSWLWRCHLCGQSYPLGATRRCLNDGHYFCAGTTISKKTGKRRTHSPCGSTFDYIGWQEYGEWRRHEQDLQTKAKRRPTSTSADKPAQNCEHNCNFPSECRWSTKLTTPSPDSPKHKSIKVTTKSDDSSNPDTSLTAIPNTKKEAPTKEFRLGKRSNRRQKSFSLPFSAYSWLVGPNAGSDDVSVTAVAGSEVNAVGGEEDADDRLWLVPAL